jgi:hypothetical protein
MAKYLYKLILIFPLVFFMACEAEEKTEEIITEAETIKPTVMESKFNAQNVFNSLPDRKIIIKLIEENKLEYNPDFLNDPSSVSKYSTEAFKAINLGIYGSDLSISSSFDQTQESMIFLKCVNILAGNLGVNSAFDQRMFERIENNKNSKDSVLEIVTDAFRKVDEILKYNNRPATSAIILSGCWIEGLYVSCSMGESLDNENIIKTIIAQKESLKNLIVMVEGVKLEPSSEFLLTDLKGLYKSFEVAESTTKFDKIALAEIAKKITALRNKATSLSN